MFIFSYPSFSTYVFLAQKYCPIEMVLLSTDNICFGWEIRKFIFKYGSLYNFLFIKTMELVCSFINISLNPVTQN